MAKLSFKKAMIIAVASGLLVTALVVSFVSKSSKPTSGEGISVVVAKVDIPAKTTIKQDMVEQIVIPKAGVQPGAVVDLQNAIGVTTREALLAGEQITEQRLAQGKTLGFIGIIPKDRRAVTVSATEVIGVAGLIKVGDAVDLYVTFDKQDVGQHATNIVLQNLTILALNRDTDSANGDTGKDKGKDDFKTFTVTLAVLPQDVSKLVLADEKGKIRLALRPYQTEGEAVPVTLKPTDLVDGTVPVENSNTNHNPPQPLVTQKQQPQEPSGGVVIMRGTQKYVAPVAN